MTAPSDFYHYFYITEMCTPEIHLVKSEKMARQEWLESLNKRKHGKARAKKKSRK